MSVMRAVARIPCADCSSLGSPRPTILRVFLSEGKSERTAVCQVPKAVLCESTKNTPNRPPPRQWAISCVFRRGRQFPVFLLAAASSLCFSPRSAIHCVFRRSGQFHCVFRRSGQFTVFFSIAASSLCFSPQLAISCVFHRSGQFLGFFSIAANSLCFSPQWAISCVFRRSGDFPVFFTAVGISLCFSQ